MASYSDVAAVHGHATAAALSKLSPAVRTALTVAGLTQAGALDALGDTPPEELRDFFNSIMGDDSLDDAYDKFLVAIKDCGGPARKIRRAYAVAATAAVVLLPEHRSLPPSTRPLALRLPPPPASAPARWPTHLRRDLAAADGPRAQGAVEEKERVRWVAQVAAILRASGLPSARLAEEALDPEAFLRRCAGGRRVRTLRLRVRAWRKVEAWLAAAGQSGFPRGDPGTLVMVAYLDARAQEPCARTVPSSIVMALSFFEDCGGVPQPDRVSAHPVLIRAVKDIEVTLARGEGHVRRKAPHFPAMIVLSLELLIVDDEVSKYRRVYAWVTLVRVWAALRFDDSVHIRPDEIRYGEDGLEAIIRRTKTTGPGKRVSVLYAFVGPGAYVARADWLQVGFALFKDLGGLPRDYLLPMPSSDLEDFRRTPVRYTDEIVLLRALLGELRRPRCTEEREWQLGAGKLVPAELTGFWSSHSHRAVLASWGATLGTPKRVMDALGRWATSGSGEYVRTSKTVVTQAQAIVGAALRGATVAAGSIDEKDLLSEMSRHLAARGYSEDALEETISALTYFRASAGYSTSDLPGVDGSQAVQEYGDDADGLARDVEASGTEAAPTAVESKPPTDELQEVEDVDGPGSYDFIISTTYRSKSRCVHAAAGCYRAKALNSAGCSGDPCTGGRRG